MSTAVEELIAQRDRPIVPNHEVHIDTQQLHALLRIEELLTSILEGMRFAAKQLSKDDVPDTSPAKGRARK